MSHFAVMVISTKGKDDHVKQLKPYDENKRVKKYDKGAVSQEEIDSFVKFYTSETSPDYKAPKDESGKEPTRDMSEYKSLTLKQLYAKFGEDWNGKSWEFIDVNGVPVPHEFSTYNPKSKWDWYEVGGRWAGTLRVKEGVAAEEPHFSWGWDENEKQEVRNAGKTDSALKGDIDWEGMMAEGRENAEKTWGIAAFHCGTDERGHIKQPQISWEDLVKRANAKEIEWDDARSLYNAQPEVTAFRKAEIGGIFGNISDLDCTQEEYGRRGANSAVATYAVLLDGEWISKGEMGWFGMSTESDKEAREWTDDFYKNFIEPLPDTALITIVDCHI